MKNKELKLLANKARQDVVRMLVQAKSGHTAGPLGMADIFTFLYHEWLKVEPTKPDWHERDYLFLSNGHICPIWYVSLAARGFFDASHLSSFRKINSLLQGHPHNETIPGVENSGGPLGQGISQASGAALALKRDGKANRVVCLMGDGELEEGMCWEAFLFAAFHGLDNLIVVIDRNHIQIDNRTEEVSSLEPLADKFRAFGFEVLEIDGHEFNEIRKAFNKKMGGRPRVIIARTVPGKGFAGFENDYTWHGKPPNDEQGHEALAELEHEYKDIDARWW